MAKQRPINEGLFTFKFPITAIVSILHRLSGLLLFISIPFLLWIFQQSLESFATFEETKDLLRNNSVRFILWLFMAGFTYHFIAGIRHLFMDCGKGETLEGGRKSAKIVFILTAILTLLAGVWLW